MATMAEFLVHLGLNFVIDPLDRFKSVPNHLLLETCGIIPGWIDRFSSIPYKRQIELGRGMPTNWRDVNINSEGVYLSKDDPALYPIMRSEHRGFESDETLYIYEYGLVGIVDADGNARMTRCD